MAGGADSETATCKRLPQNTLVGAGEAVDIRLDPSITGGEDYTVDVSAQIVTRSSGLRNSQVGLHGWSGRASRKRWRKTAFPAVEL